MRSHRTLANSRERFESPKYSWTYCNTSFSLSSVRMNATNPSGSTVLSSPEDVTHP